MHTLLDLLTGWTLFLALALITGAVVMRWVVLRDHPEDHSAAAGVGLRASGLLLLGLGLVLGRQVMEFHDPFNPWIDDAQVLMGTAWGKTWFIATSVAVLAALAFARARARRRNGWLLATACVLALDAFPALTGHANGGDLRGVTLIADTLHVLAMGAWIGTLGLILIFERRHRRRLGQEEAGSLLPELVPRFSPVALASVVTLVATGVLASWIHLGSMPALVTTPYGRLLLLKVSLVGVVFTLGALNWRRHTPRLSEGGGQARMRRAATTELVIANLVLLVTAVLVRTSPK